MANVINTKVYFITKFKNESYLYDLMELAVYNSR